MIVKISVFKTFQLKTVKSFQIIPICFQSHKGIQETAVRVFRRYMQLFPDNAEEYFEYLVSIDRLDEASVLVK
jgi:hypothetical protein